MSLDAPAVLGGATSGAVDFGVWRFIRGIGVREVRIATGLVMFSYLLSHFTNHALGNFSFALMQEALQYHLAWWRNPVITLLFYGAAAVHFLLGLWALYQRRHFRYATAEIIQLVLGLSIPLLLITHFAGVRLPSTLFGRGPNYGLTLNAYWFVRPHMIWVQFALMLVAWAHACIGIYFWVRMKPLFKWAAPADAGDRRAATADCDARRASGRARGRAPHERPGVDSALHHAAIAAAAKNHR